MKDSKLCLSTVLIAVSLLFFGCGNGVSDDDVISYVENLDEYKDWDIISSEIVLSDTEDKKHHSYNVDITATNGYLQLVSHKKVNYQKYDQGWEVTNTSDDGLPEITLARELTDDEILEIYSQRSYSFSKDMPELTIQSSTQDIGNNKLTIVMNEIFDEKYGEISRVISEEWILSSQKQTLSVKTSNIDSVDYLFNYDSFKGEIVTKGIKGDPYYGQFKLDSVEYNPSSDEINWSGYIYYVEVGGQIIEGNVSGVAKYFKDKRYYMTSHAQIENPNLGGLISTLYYDVVFDIKKGLGVGFESSIEYSNE